jgi:hypothetical protein
MSCTLEVRSKKMRQKSIAMTHISLFPSGANSASAIELSFFPREVPENPLMQQ